jgi:DNA-binding IclR family transcriptional regulator
MTTSGERRAGDQDALLTSLSLIAANPNGVRPADLSARTGGDDERTSALLDELIARDFVQRGAEGALVLGDEFLRLAFFHQASRPETAELDPVLRTIARRFGVTAEYARLQGKDIVIRHRVGTMTDAPRYSRLIGARVPAHRTAIGKVLLAARFPTEQSLLAWGGSPVLEAHTERTINWIAALHEHLELVREQGYAVDDQEDEPGVIGVAVAAEHLGLPGGIGLSTLATRATVADLVGFSADAVRMIRRGSAES